MIRLIGMPTSEGIALAQSSIIRRQNRIKLQYSTILSSEKHRELELFQLAVQRAAEELAEIHATLQLESRDLDAEIIEVQLFFLRDVELLESIESKINDLLYSAQLAVQQAMEEIVNKINKLETPYLQQRIADLKDVCWRLSRNLRGEYEQCSPIQTQEGTEKIILICEDLTPSEAVKLDPNIVVGLATAEGGSMSHVAIIARSLGIPAVVGIGTDLLHINDGEWLLLNGTTGIVTADAYHILLEQYQQHCTTGKSTLSLKRSSFMSTANHLQTTILSNISSLAEARIAKNNGSAGVGLFRTEFLFMGRDDLPSAEEQFIIYKELVTIFGADAPIIIRTMDVGGDKQLSSLPIKKEDNPFLGLRGIRVSLSYPEQFRIQLRAILKASSYGLIKILIPMISTVEEWNRVRYEIEQAKIVLRTEGIPFNEKIEVGILVEVPAVALLIDRFLDTTDFISIGTNDLTQYVMAVSRSDTNLSQLHDPLQPAVLQLISHIITAAHLKNRKVSVCGEMASHPLAAPLLLGLGIDMLSVNYTSALPDDLPLFHQNKQQLRELAREVLTLDSPVQIKRYLQNKLMQGCEI